MSKRVRGDIRHHAINFDEILFISLVFLSLVCFFYHCFAHLMQFLSPRETTQGLKSFLFWRARNAFASHKIVNLIANWFWDSFIVRIKQSSFSVWTFFFAADSKWGKKKVHRSVIAHFNRLHHRLCQFEISNWWLWSFSSFSFLTLSRSLSYTCFT